VASARSRRMLRRNKESVQVPSQCVFVCPGGVVETRLVAGQMRQARWQGAMTTAKGNSAIMEYCRIGRRAKEWS
jgi:Fe-S-cluster-containing hydrogenase component 2